MRRVGGERAGDGDALALAAREVGAALLDHRVVALRQLGDELVGARRACAIAITWARGMAGFAEGDVVVDGAVEQQVLLQHDADVAAQPGRIDLGEVGAVEQDLPFARACRGAGAAWSASTCPSPTGRRCRSTSPGRIVQRDVLRAPRARPAGSGR